MSSPVSVGTSMASVIFFQRSVYCHGIMSSSQAMLYFSRALPRRMQELRPMWPKWSADSGTSMPTCSRTAATKSAILARVAAELFDLAENFVDVAGVLAQEAALEE